MSERHVVRCFSREPLQYEWLRAGTLGAPATGSAADCAAALGGAPAVVVLDGSAVRLTGARVPGRAARVVAQAVPYAIEDELADDVEQLHFAIGAADAGGVRPVAVVARDLLHGIVEPLVAAGVACEAAVAAMLALPDCAPRWTVAFERGCVLVREGPAAGYAVEAPTAARILARRIADASPPGIVFFAARGEDVPAEVRAACGGIATETQSAEAGGLALFALHLPDRAVLDLLPDALRRREQQPRSRRLYTAAALIAGLALVLHLALTGYEVASLKQRLGSLKAAETATFHRAFPAVQRLVEGALRTQAEQELARLRDQHKPAASFLDLLAASGNALGAQRAQGVNLRGFTFSDGYLTLRLDTPDVAVLEQYRQALGAAVSAEVVSAESGEHGVTGTLRLRATGS
ncbi:MAG: hypothetical protein HY749_18495 [Gammaproteobacteria bacterium]|nr:hypothetical protein [Gammaproteobacteria bacterium]